MQKLLLMFFFIGISTIGFSQNYIPFPTENATWSVEEYVYSFDITIPDECIAIHYGYDGDTLISGNTYGKLYANNLISDYPYEAMSFNSETAHYVAAIREDTTRKVWMRRPNDTIDILYYDFDLSVGDTFCFEGLGMGCYEVENTDSVFFKGELRKGIRFLTSNGEVWVEGIGSLTGWLEWQYTGNIGNTLRCFTQNGNPVYEPSQCHCDTYTSTKEISWANQIKVFPNPVKDELSIELDIQNMGEFDISLKMMTGKEVRQLNSTEKLIQVNLDGLENGIYFLFISNSKNQTVVQKIIISN